MRTADIPLSVWLVGSLVLIGGAYIYLRGVRGVAKDAASAVVNVGAGVIQGTVETAGSIAGIPLTDLQKCELAIKEGRTTDASFYCPLPRFATYLTTGK